MSNTSARNKGRGRRTGRPSLVTEGGVKKKENTVREEREKNSSRYRKYNKEVTGLAGRRHEGRGN